MKSILPVLALIMGALAPAAQGGESSTQIRMSAQEVLSDELSRETATILNSLHGTAIHSVFRGYDLDSDNECGTLIYYDANDGSGPIHVSIFTIDWTRISDIRIKGSADIVVTGAILDWWDRDTKPALGIRMKSAAPAERVVAAMKMLQKECARAAPAATLTNNPWGPEPLSQEEESDVSGYLGAYCLSLLNLRSEKDFNKKLMASMHETAARGNIDPYWQNSACEPRFLKPPTRSPLIHIVAENTRDRAIYIQYLQKYYEKKNDLATFRKVLNAKNTRGQTVLDYIHQTFIKKYFLRQEEAALNKFIQYLCDNGAKYSYYAEKKCPAEYLYIYK